MRGAWLMVLLGLGCGGDTGCGVDTGCGGDAERGWEGAYVGQLSQSARFTVEGRLRVAGGGADNTELRVAKVSAGRYRLEMPGCAAEADVSGERLHVDPRTQCTCVAGDAEAPATVAGQATRADGQLRVTLEGTTAEGACEWSFTARP
ncbi:MAG: hypothetical protein AAF447_10040 [Myxococcota bacterium]